MFRHKHFFSAVLNFFALVVLVIHAQNNNDQSGFISLDCGIPRDSNYTEPTSLINYVSDAPLIDSGEVHSVADEYIARIQEPFKTLRSFPEGTRNCYKIGVMARTRYLVRATFFHGNYDGLETLPEFSVHIGGNFWDTVTIYDVSTPALKEMIHVTATDRFSFCLVNTGSGTPFVSAIELRPMSDNVYYNNSGPYESLSLEFRNDIGSNRSYWLRFPYDSIDRVWNPVVFSERWTAITTSNTVDANSTNKYRIPNMVLNTMETPTNDSSPMQLFWTARAPQALYYFYLHFAELQELKANESRAFNITVNGEDFYQNLVPVYLRTTTLYNQIASSGSANYTISLDRIENSTLPPILNAIEAYFVVDLSQPETYEQDVDAINEIKSSYEVDKINWDGDPCVPKVYLWIGLNCSYSGVDPPRIISLNLSASGLSGEISRHILNLSTIETLDLSNNNLTGSVPNFLSRLPNLRVLNLERNNLSGSVPIELIEKVNKGALSLRVGDNIHLCDPSICNDNINTKKKKSNILIPIVASVGGLVVLFITVTAILLALQKKKRRESKPQPKPFESVKRQYSFAEVERITNNFENILGKGGFGEVYHGFIDENTQVAVKVLSSSSRQGFQEFETEVNILLKVYHGNLTSLIGYCYEEPNMVLIYEYMSNGDLGSLLSGNSLVSWEGRLQIAVDAAQGLEYLHNGCKPPIIHRDIKPPNILLGDNFRAKLADFGLSKSFPTNVGGHVSTVVAGTPGYVDPRYKETGWLNEKSDVFSFGVVLLQMISRRPAMMSTGHTDADRVHISQWVGSVLSTGVIASVVDASLEEDFDINSAWKAVEIGMACASQVPSNRPNMSEVVSDLKECLALERTRKSQLRAATPTPDSYEMLSNAASEFRPLAR